MSLSYENQTAEISSINNILARNSKYSLDDGDLLYSTTPNVPNFFYKSNTMALMRGNNMTIFVDSSTLAYNYEGNPITHATYVLHSRFLKFAKGGGIDHLTSRMLSERSTI
ncbi:hypothetical protein NPIL_194681 [Nephila pilipes]|uniref:Uncharacterized protein n=1 Tax=Nephila pilipes TaxID=299642 RepID=A0A8X6PHM0_NEPPI|nr:hypothetical protein NPIL_194681 [Nephila pilipes]